MEKQQTIGIIDDHQEFIADLKEYITRQIPGVEIKSAFTAEEGLVMVGKERPDVVLVDIHLQGKHGLITAIQVKRILPESHIITMSLFEKADSPYAKSPEIVAFFEKSEINGSRFIPLLNRLLKSKTSL